MPYATVQPPIPVQAELVPPQPIDTLNEYRACFRDDSVLLPELAVRYLIWLVTADADPAEVKAFAFMVRTELNEQRMQRFMVAS